MDAAAAAQAIAVVILGVGLLQALIHTGELLVATATLALRPPVRPAAVIWRRLAHAAPSISIVSPAFNEERTIVESVRSLLSLNYPSLEVVVVDDGSADATLQRLIAAFELEPAERPGDLRLSHAPIRALLISRRDPRLTVLSKANGGKADALNAGLNVASGALVCAIDADSVLESDALLRLAEPFIDQPGLTVAAGGAVRVANGCRIVGGQMASIAPARDLLSRIQSVEYLRAFLLARLAWSRMNALTIVSGAFGLFRRDVLIGVGGYRTDTVGEDMEIIVRLHRRIREAGRPYRIVFTPDPVCWTEAPADLRSLGRQRARWQRGSLETLHAHRGMLLRGRYGPVGTLALPSTLVIDGLGPLLEVLGYLLLPLFVGLGLLSTAYLAAFFAVTAGFGLVTSVGALTLEELEFRRYPRGRHLLSLLSAAVVENFGYRQLSNLWRLRGWIQFLRRDKAWGRLTRRGFSQVDA